jgi:hypothetical protein
LGAATKKDQNSEHGDQWNAGVQAGNVACRKVLEFARVDAIKSHHFC